MPEQQLLHNQERGAWHYSQAPPMIERLLASPFLSSRMLDGPATWDIANNSGWLRRPNIKIRCSRFVRSSQGSDKTQRTSFL
jgi:hypothetical protein